MKKINARLNDLLEQSKTDFPLSTAEAAEFRANLRNILFKISEVEKMAVDLLQNAIV